MFFNVCLRSHSFLLCTDWWKSDSSVDGEPQGNWRWNSNPRHVVVSCPSYSYPTARAPRRACWQASPTDFLSGSINKLMVTTEPAVQSTRLLGPGVHIPGASSACSTKILLNSCRVFLEYSKPIGQVKESYASRLERLVCDVVTLSLLNLPVVCSHNCSVAILCSACLSYNNIILCSQSKLKSRNNETLTTKFAR